MKVEINGMSYNLEKNRYESDDIFYNRIWFIVSQKPQNSSELKKAIHNSILWSNIKYLNCFYSKDINNYIKNLEKKIYSIY